MPPFEYEPLVLFLKLKTSSEEEDKGDIYGVGPLGTRIAKEPGGLKGRTGSLEKEAVK